MESPYKSPLSDPTPEGFGVSEDVNDLPRVHWLVDVSGWLGVLSVLLFPAPLAVIFSLIGLGHLRTMESERGEAVGRRLCWFGLVLGVIGTGLLVWMMV